MSSGEKIENLGRSAVIRFVGSLGMARYAHRFRAFAVTGADLAVCTEDDLVQIGISFRCGLQVFTSTDSVNHSPIRGGSKSL